MRRSLKPLVAVAVFGIFYVSAFFIMKGAESFEKRGETALFTSKTEAAAIDNAEAYENTPPALATAVWK